MLFSTKNCAISDSLLDAFGGFLEWDEIIIYLDDS